NKCHNEKKRRELENETINQLEELLGTCLAEVKQPDKNGIVREATRQIQEALKHYTGSLEWILLEINSKGEIECVTENIKDLILRDRTELYKKSIYSLVHVKDHAKLRPLLRCIQTYNWSSGETDKFQAIQAVQYVIMQGVNVMYCVCCSVVEAVIHASPVRGSSEEAGSVMCVIRRCEDASAALPPVGGGPPAITAKQQDHIVFRLDCNFSILCMNIAILLACDLSGVENFSNTPVSLVGTRYLELVDSGDRARVASHLAEAACLPAPPALSEPFRLRVAADRPPIRVSARSRLFRAKPSSGESDFIMSTHSVLGDDDMEVMDGGSRTPPLGGPMMPSEDEEATGSETSAPHTPHTPLTPMSPLHTPQSHSRPSPHGPHPPHVQHAHASHQQHPQHSQHQPQTSQHSHMSPATHSHQQGHTNLLSKVRMLSEKTDDDAEDSRRNSNENRGVSQPSALLSQLLSNSNGPNNGRSQDASDSYLERIGGIKRKFEEAKGMTLNVSSSAGAASVASSAASSSAPSPAAGSSPGMSPLCQKNQILVSLLAKQQTTPTTPLPLPNPRSILQTTPSSSKVCLEFP
ncbi:Steroid receptor coactivator, partial [Operophtera brumata]